MVSWYDYKSTRKEYVESLIEFNTLRINLYYGAIHKSGKTLRYLDTMLMCLKHKKKQEEA